MMNPRDWTLWGATYIRLRYGKPKPEIQVNVTPLLGDQIDDEACPDCGSFTLFGVNVYGDTGDPTTASIIGTAQLCAQCFPTTNRFVQRG